MKNSKKLFHVSADEDGMQKLLWAKAKAIDEYKRGLLSERVKSHSDSIVWMFNKIQQLSKVLKGRLDDTDDDTNSQKDEDDKEEDDDDEPIKSSE